MKLRGRISLQFLFQFLILFGTVFLIFITLFLLLIKFISNDEFNENPLQGAAENIPYFTMIDDDQHIDLSNRWKEMLEKYDIWMQIIDQKGDVIYDNNTSQELPSSYSTQELFRMEDTKEFQGSKIATYYETWEDKPYYYIFGLHDNNQETLDGWFQKYNDNGRVDADKQRELEEQLANMGSTMEVYHHNELVQRLGQSVNHQDNVLGLIESVHTPGLQKEQADMHHDEETDSSWVLYTPNDDYTGKASGISTPSMFTYFAVAALISLGVAIAFSIWNGYRYGKPLFLMIRLLEGIENRSDGPDASDNVYQRIYKRNGKLKIRYRLYKEVIQSFVTMKQKLDAAEEERAHLDKTREEWMAGISHDLRTPLTSIQGYAYMLQSDKYNYSNEELNEIGSVIRGKSDYMVELLDDFSLIFKLKHHTLPIEKLRIDLNDFVAQTGEKFKHDRTMKGYQFSIETLDDPVMSAIDPKWFRRVLDNLIYNAVKHNPSGTTVTVRVRKWHEAAAIDVTDDGIGIEDDVRQHLFESYYRGTNTEGRTEGDGLGMSIAKAIIDLHGGRINVDSAKDKGTRITIFLDEYERGSDYI